MLVAAAAWDDVADELTSAAASFSATTSGLAGSSWLGAASVAMTAAAAPYVGWLRAAVAGAEQTAGQARTVAGIFEAAQAAIVHPAVVATNRSQLVSLVLSNLFGQNVHAIAATEATYEQMWAQDVAAMVGYHSGASAAVSALTPFAGPLKSLAGLLGLAGGANTAGSVADSAAASRINVGLSNVGSLNVGLGNIGSFNFGNSNIGTGNFGSGNNGTSNFGSGNLGNGNVGFGNSGPSSTAGNGNVGIGNTGNNNIGFGNTGTGNYRYRTHRQ